MKKVTKKNRNRRNVLELIVETIAKSVQWKKSMIIWRLNQNMKLFITISYYDRTKRIFWRLVIFNDLKPNNNIFLQSGKKCRYPVGSYKDKFTGEREMPSLARPTLLEMLLKDEIRKERNQILQALHYIVQNDFFDNKWTLNRYSTRQILNFRLKCRSHFVAMVKNSTKPSFELVFERKGLLFVSLKRYVYLKSVRNV